MLTEEDKRKAACTMILMCMQVIIVCSWKRRIAMRAALRQPRLRVRIAPFHGLVKRLWGFGLRNSCSVTIEEQVAMFLGTVAHDVRYRKMKYDFFSSSQIVCHEVLNAVLRLYTEVVTSPTPANSPADCENSKEWHHFLKDAIGAIDDTHFAANVLREDQPRYRNRKGIVSQNVLVGCSFDMKFTYLLTRWEGSAHDGLVLRSVVCREGRKLTIPTGEYYLADARYANCPGFLTPYRGVSL